MTQQTATVSRASTDPVIVPVELVFPELRAVASGAVVEMSGQCALLKLAHAVESQERAPAVGDAVWITYLSGKIVYRAQATISRQDGLLLLVQFTSAAERVVRRTRHRFTCSLPVVYRAIRPSGYGAWQGAELYDINLTGAGLRVAAEVRFPPRLQLRMNLPLGIGQIDILRLSDAAEASEPIKLSGKARHGRFTRDGDTVVGVRFDYLPPPIHLKLSCFVERLCIAGA